MLRKLLIVVLCGFVQCFECTRVKFDPSFQPIYRNDINSEPVFKREHFYPREVMAPGSQVMPQQTIIRGEPVFGNDPLLAHQLSHQAVLPNEEFLSNNQVMQGESFIRAEPILRRDPFIRREPVLRREAFIRSEPIIPVGRIYQNTPIIRESGIFRNDPNALTIMMPQCQCQQSQDGGQTCPHGNFLQIQQPIQPVQQLPMTMQQTSMAIQPSSMAMQQSPMTIQQGPLALQHGTMTMQQAPITVQQPILTQRICFPKTLLKSQTFQPIVTYPRIQRFVRKNFKPIAENIQFQATSISNTPVQGLGNEHVAFSDNFQSQGQQQESTSESVTGNPVTVRSLPNPLALAQVSSIC